MERATQTLTTPQTTPAGTFSVKIENTTYVVGVHFSRTAKTTLEDKRIGGSKRAVAAFRPQNGR